jgi:hypothetical protein
MAKTVTSIAVVAPVVLAGLGTAYMLAPVGAGASVTEPSQDAVLAAIAAVAPEDWVFSDPLSPEIQAAAFRLREAEIAACMQEHGFDYHVPSYEPVTPPENGYGVIDNYGQPASSGAAAMSDGINAASELSAAEQDRFFDTLGGRQDLLPAEVVIPLDERGCFGEATRKVFGVLPTDDPRIVAAVNEHYRNLDNDAEMKSALGTWVDCLTDAEGPFDDVPGYVFEEPLDAAEYVQFLVRVEEGLTVEQFADERHPPIPDNPTLFQGSVFEDGIGLALIGVPQPLTATQIDDLRAREIRIHAADLECRDASRIDEIRHDREQASLSAMRTQNPELFEP